MLAPSFQGICNIHELFFWNAFCGYDVCNYRVSACYGSGFIQNNHIYLTHFLQRLGCLEQNSLLGSNAISYHDCNRCRKSQRTRTTDHQNSDCPFKGIARGLSNSHPNYKRKSRKCNYNRNKDSGHLIRNLGNRCLCCRGVTDHLDDFGEGRIFTYMGGSAFYISGLVNGRCGHLVARSFINRNGFACEGRLVNCGCALQYHTVHRNPLAGFNNENVIHHNLLCRNGDFISVSYNECSIRGKCHEAFKRIRRATFRHSLKHLSYRNQGQNHCSRFKIELMHKGHDLFGVARPLGCEHIDKNVNAP